MPAPLVAAVRTMQRHLPSPALSHLARLPLLAALTGACLLAQAAPAAPAPQTPFAMVAHLPVHGVAEIVAATPDGQHLFYTSADAGELGVVDIRDPAHPRTLPPVNVRLHGIGEPTSVAITPDGRYAVLALRLDDDKNNPRRGLLRIYDIRDKAAITHVRDITVGIGPDSLALAGSGRRLRAVVAIEDEESDAKGDATLGGQRPGFIDVVGLESLYGGADSGLQRLDLVAALRATPGVLYPEDPQPEFVAIRADGREAVVSLQENNAVAVVDLSHPRRARLARVFSAGTVTRTGNADLQRDKEIRFQDSFTGRREPDAVTWVSNSVIALANEGDGKKGADGTLPGGRGFTLMDVRGQVVFETGDRTERHAVQHGHYPDARSAAKGVEIESVASAHFGGRPYLLVGSERGAFVEVWRLDQPGAPTFVQLLPTGQSPEGLTTITRRRDGQQLFVTANEGDGSLNLYRFHAQGAPANPADVQVVAASDDMPWGAISGLTSDGTHLWAVPDNAFATSRIWRIDTRQVATAGRMVIDQALMLTDGNGQPLKLDPEGIARVADGFWIASEGATVDGNELVKVDFQGRLQRRVKLPASITQRFASPKISTGFEGVTASPDGQTLYMAVQRGFDPAKPQAAILRWHIPSDAWTTALYPLEQHSQNPKGLWMGLSEIQLTPDGRLLVLERDKGGGEARAITAEVKRIYSVRVADIAENAVLGKTLVRDLRKDLNFVQEKAEGMALHQGRLWVASDNDGAGWTRMVDAGTP